MPVAVEDASSSPPPNQLPPDSRADLSIWPIISASNWRAESFNFVFIPAGTSAGIELIYLSIILK